MSLSRPASFPLLKLPWLCIKCVIHNSDLFAIIYFATISSRTRGIVKASKYPLKEIGVDPSGNRSIYMEKTIGEATDRKVWCFMNGYHAYHDKFVLQKNSQPFRIRESIDRRGTHYLNLFTTGDTLDAMKMGIEFMIDVFGCTIRQVFINGDQLLELFRLGIKSVKELLIGGFGPDDTTYLKYILETIKVTDSFIFQTKIPNDFSCDPRIFKCRHLCFACGNSADWVTLEILCQLDVPQLYFMHHRFPVEDIVSYITYWFNSENRKLEYFCVYFKDSVTEEDFKIDHLNPMPFCEKRRNICLFAGAWKNTDMSSGMDILRQDGLLATLIVKPNSILFYVWHKRFPDAVEV